MNLRQRAVTLLLRFLAPVVVETILLIAGTNCWATDAPAHLDLAGAWQIRLDTEEMGESRRWFADSLAGQQTIVLPNTTDRAGLGFPLDKQTMRYPTAVQWQAWPATKEVQRRDHAGTLARDHLFIGKAWYERTFSVPQGWANTFVRLHLERVLWQSRVWLDGREIGSYDSLVAGHNYDLGVIVPGKHRLTICIDNGMIHNIGLVGHAYGAETQSRWNGILGEITLTATAPVFIRGMQTYPAVDQQSVRVRVAVSNKADKNMLARLRLSVQPEDHKAPIGEAESSVSIKPGEQVIEQEVKMTQAVKAWDEFNTTRYRMTAVIEADQHANTHDCLFGFRHIQRDGRYIRVNGRRVFLRGTLDCCVYPKTGHPPMTVEGWSRILSTIKDYGFNHIRFHTWCPPDAAFEVADRLGIYLAPETPFWVDDWTVNKSTRPKPLGRDQGVTDYVRREMRRIADAYGNHPSFALFCIGNEFGNQGTDWETVNQLLAEAKRRDGRRLYNATTARKRVAADDYWVTHHSGKGTRGIGPAHTNWDFTRAAQATDLPLIAHETGQRPVFPDYDNLLPKFKGPLKPYHLLHFREQLANRGMADQVSAFERASAQFQLLQYKAEHEGMLRTPDYAGYQLLMLNDFTGQSAALVGILDPFWEPKGIVSAEQVRRWNAPTVALARFDRFTWTADQEFKALLEVSHFGPRDLTNVTPKWSLVAANGNTIAEGALDRTTVPSGQLTQLGEMSVSLSGIESATAMTLTVRVDDTTNQWAHWVYPRTGADAEPDDGDVLIAKGFNDEVERELAEGRRVLILGHGLKNNLTAQTGFASVYWSAGWWGNAYSALGIMCDPSHPALAHFPNNGHSDWQWHELTSGATTFMLDSAPPGFRPIVQPVTDFHHNRLLGQVFEARVGKGRLLACGYDLATNLKNRHNARQFRKSLLAYMNSSDFEPKQELEIMFTKQLLRQNTE